MVKVIIYLLLQFIVLNPIFSKWIKVDNAETSIDYVCIRCADSMNCFVAGNAGSTDPFGRVTYDGGKTWKTTLKDTVYTDTLGKKYFPSVIVDAAYPDTNLCIVLCEDGYYLRSTDNCHTWVRYNLETKSKNAAIHFFDKNFGVVTSYNECYLTNDGGLNWSLKKSSMSTDSILNSFYRVNVVNPNHIFLTKVYAVFKNGIFTDNSDSILVSNDFGMNWNTYLLPNDGSRSVFFIDSLNGWITQRYKGGPMKYMSVIIHTTDGGKSWFKQLDTLNYPYYGLSHIYFSDSLNGVAVGYYWELWKTKDGGKKWIRDTSSNSNNLDMFLIDVAFMTPKKLIGATWKLQGVFIYEDDVVGVDETWNLKNESDFGIYPNPANSSEEINVKYNLSFPSTVRFKIYNSSGEQVDSPFESFFSDGWHTIKYKPEIILPSGVYWLKLEIGKKFEVKPFVLLN